MERNFLSNAEDLIPPVNDTPYKRILAIGDVHGCFNNLISLWEKIAVTPDDLVIFLGDYVEDGDQNVNVLRWLMEKTKSKNIIALRGNVDDLFLEAFDAPNIINDRWSDAAKELYNAAKTEHSLAIKVYDFLKSTPYWHRMQIGGRDYIFCHAGINIEKPLSRHGKNKDDLIWEHDNFYSEYEGDAVIVVGHKSPRKIMKVYLPQCSELDTLKPVRIPQRNILLLDTRAKDIFRGREGYLSAVDILSGEFWQS